MKIIRHLKDFQSLDPAIITIGNFDGMHLGHQTLLRTLTQTPELCSTVILFEPQPQEFFSPEKAPARLSRLRDKLAFLKSMGIQQVVCLHFDAALSTLSAEDFIENILLKSLRMKQLVIGHDFRFGAARKGDIALLKKYGAREGFTVTEAPICEINHMRVSSSQIRAALAAGDMQTATDLLGHPYVLSGHVLRGDQRGRQLGFPTANIALGQQHLPLNGVFIVRAYGAATGESKGVANLGVRPTVDGQRLLLEVHLLNFNGDLYGKKVSIEFLRKIRDEKKFASLDELKNWIQRDVDTAKMWWKQHKFF